MKKQNLKTFSKNKKQKNIIIGSIIGVILLIGGITLYRTFALYEEKKEFNVLKGQVADFRNTFSKYIINQSKTDETIEKFEHEATAQTPALTDYRYTGSNPSNYVYFGCEGNETSPCTDDNLYRIIGVMPTQKANDGEYENRVKLIKANDWVGASASDSNATITGKGYKWNTANANKWEDSSLNRTLNSEYYNSLGDYQKYIESTKWYLGALTHSNYRTYKVEEYYIAERGNNKGYSKGALSIITNIGLMYPSDFAYSLDKENNSIVTSKSQYDNQELYKTKAWLYQNNDVDYREWTITPESSYYDEHGSSATITRFEGYIYTTARVNHSASFFAVRPTFYLKSDVLYESGNGTQENPFRISIN